MTKTPPTPEILGDALAVAENALKSAESGYGLFPGALDAVSNHLSRLQLSAKLCLPEALQKLTRFKLEDEVQEGDVVVVLQETRSILRRALAFVNFRQQEKASFTDEEMSRMRNLSQIPSRFSNITSLWDMDLQRMEQAQYDHQWSREDWGSAMPDNGAHVRRLVSWKETRDDRGFAAALLADVQKKRGKYHLLNVLEHPAAPGSAEELLRNFLENLDLPLVTATVRERRSAMWKLLEGADFKAVGIIRNFYRFENDFEDGYIMKFEK